MIFGKNKTQDAGASGSSIIPQDRVFSKVDIYNHHDLSRNQASFSYSAEIDSKQLREAICDKLHSTLREKIPELADFSIHKWEKEQREATSQITIVNRAEIEIYSNNTTHGKDVTIEVVSFGDVERKIHNKIVDSVSEVIGYLKNLNSSQLPYFLTQRK